MEGAHPLDEMILKTNQDPYAKYPTLRTEITSVTETVGTYTKYLEKQLDSSNGLESAQEKFNEQYTERLKELLEWQKDPLFNTTFLKDFDGTQKHLLDNEGFKAVSFTTEDGVNLAGLCKLREKAKFNIIVSNGFTPGKKEGMATLLKLFPNSCNMLLFDARSHGESEGNLWRDVLWSKYHGRDEYKDIWAAVEHMNTKAPNARNILYGTCEGAFHSANAILEAQSQGCLDELNIEALIFDSGWDKFVEAGYSVAKQNLTGCYRPLYYGASLLYQTWLKGYDPLISGYRSIQETRDLPHRMSNFPNSIKTVFIHGVEDRDVPIENIRTLHGNRPQGTSVMYESSVPNPHALMQVKDKLRYALWMRKELEALELIRKFQQL